MTCFKCKHFTLRWGHRLPYACKAWGIHSKRYPGLMVRAISGYPCQLYQPCSKDSEQSSKTGQQQGSPSPPQIDKII